jgi:hypothetical protein
MSTPSPHPLTVLLIERLRDRPRAAILEMGAGSGRNTAALTAAGFSVTAVDDDRVATFEPDGMFAGALSTHALLHGTPATIQRVIGMIARALLAGAPFYATFASKSDARYGEGTLIEPDVFAADTGDEAGVPHVYFDERGVRALLEPLFIIETLEEQSVDEIVGRWAHMEKPRGAVHWFSRARRR